MALGITTAGLYFISPPAPTMPSLRPKYPRPRYADRSNQTAPDAGLGSRNRHGLNPGFSGRFPHEQLGKPIQRLLADPFQLRSHTETKGVRVYVLATAPAGPKLKLVTEASRMMSFGRGFLRGRSANLDLMSRALAVCWNAPY